MINYNVDCYFLYVVTDRIWNIDNPDIISLPSANPDETHAIKFISCINDRIWVGCGPSIIFLNTKDPSIHEVRE